MRNYTINQIATMDKKKHRLYSLIGISLFMVATLSRIFGDTTKNKIYKEESQQKYFASIPHFTIQSKTIENFYKFLKKTYDINDEEKLNIVIISPDHFNASKNNVDMFCKNTNNFCYKWICLPTKKLPPTKTSWCLKDGTTNEHGLGEHFTFIQKTFPQAHIFPIVVKPRKFIENTQLIDTLNSYNFIGKTLIISSVDFSHYVDEDFAILHDRKSLYTIINETEISAYAKLEVDCPSCLYITNILAQQNNHYPKLYLRDSSSSIANENLGTENTSRQFIYYTNQKQEENGFTLAFFGDLIFDRQVAKTLSNEQKIRENFKIFFQNEDTKLSLSTYPHRKLFGIDFVGVNLETPAVKEKKICQKSNKEVVFCSSSDILPYLKNIGFTLINVANNHSFDGWIEAHKETIENIKENRLNYIGYIRNGKYFEKNYLRRTNIRGIKVARQWFDFTITPRNLFSTYCEILQKNTKDGYVNIVSVHRGNEYQSKHSVEQESLGKQLIDCWADVIIGHHPHVIQDIWRYKGKPIIYSLGNFLFDMKNPPETRKGGYVLIDYNNSGKITLSTGTINASIYKE